jgi:hypothetical protein
VFLASDYVDQQLLCLIAAASLALFKMEMINDVSSRVIFGAARTVAALDAAPLAGLDMAPVLEPGGGLALYSRAVRISKVLPPSLVPSLPSPGLTLNQVLVTERFTLHTEHCTLHTAHCTLHTAHCTLHTAPARVAMLVV